MPQLPVRVARDKVPGLGLEPSSTPSRTSGGTAGELPAERAKASFDVTAMTHVIDGGAANTERRKWIQSYIKPSEFHSTWVFKDCDRGELLQEFMRNFLETHRPFAERGFKPTPYDLKVMSNSSFQFNALNVHQSLFVTTLRGQASDEQLEWWLDRALKMQITGAYCQTELGMGSNVRGLQTTATFDRETDSFILNTPTLSAVKWWPTGLYSATHAAVYAQLHIDGKPYGLHVFMVQMRGPDLKPLPGIEVGDVGTKMGEPCDIGMCSFSNVRVPRTHMMAKRQYVTREGKYVRRSSGASGGGPSKMAYLTMVITRAGMVGKSASVLAAGATIAARYSCVRRQGFVNTQSVQGPLDAQRQIIDYAVQRRRVLKHIAASYALLGVSEYVSSLVMAAMGAGDDAGDLLAELHAASSGLKALSVVMCGDGLEDLRRACGGHGYLLSSGIAAMEADFKGPFLTAEGEPVVLSFQLSRYLIKRAQDARQAKPMPRLCSILEPLRDASFATKEAVHEPASMTGVTLAWLLKLFQYRALVVVADTSSEFEATLRSGKSFDEAWTAMGGQLYDMAVYFTKTVVLDSFANWIEGVEDAACRSVLQQLCELYAVGDVLDESGWGGFVSRGTARLLVLKRDELCAALRPDVIALVEAWDIPDVLLNSAIGSRDGAYMERLYEAAIKSPLNMLPNGERVEVPAHLEALRPYLDVAYLAEGAGRQSRL